MKSESRRWLSYPLVLFGLACLLALNLCATSLTVCGNVDGGPTDPDGLANGRITAACIYPGGSFTGTVTESVFTLTYRIEISGDFFGTASDAAFVTGRFDNVTGDGDVYPFANIAFLRSQPVGGPTEFTTGSEYLRLTAIATNQGFPAIMTARPLAEVPLPAVVPESLGSIGPMGSFSGEGTLNLALDYQAGATNHYFSYPVIIVQASSAPDRVIPEPAAVFLVGSGIVSLIAFAEKRRILSLSAGG